MYLRPMVISSLLLLIKVYFETVQLFRKFMHILYQYTAFHQRITLRTKQNKTKHRKAIVTRLYMYIDVRVMRVRISSCTYITYLIPVPHWATCCAA